MTLIIAHWSSPAMHKRVPIEIICISSIWSSPVWRCVLHLVDDAASLSRLNVVVKSHNKLAFECVKIQPFLSL